MDTQSMAQAPEHREGSGEDVLSPSDGSDSTWCILYTLFVNPSAMQWVGPF
jgi:hypothetical protein